MRIVSGGADTATVYAVFADIAEAEAIGRAMVETGLAACVNILGPCTSIYRWEGRIERATEVPALFKTRADAMRSLIAAIVEAHSYSTPAVMGWRHDAVHESYAQWIGDSLS